MKKARGTGGVYLRGGTWWCRYSIGGRAIRISTGLQGGTPDKPPKAVVEKWAEKLGELGRGQTPETRQPRFEDLKEAVISRYQAEERYQSLKNAVRAYCHLSGRFRGFPVSSITEQAILAYAVSRRDEDGAAVATVNLELKMLRRGYRLLRKRIPDPPEINQLPGAVKRRGTVPDETLSDIIGRLPQHYAAMAWFLRVTGWRSCEPPRLQWRHVDWEAQSVRLDKTKNGKPRERAFGGDRKLHALLRLIRSRQRQAGLVTPWVFCVPSGKPVKVETFRAAWTRACKLVGYKGGAHNLRRTRTREQEIQGIPPTIGMAMVGIETFSVYRDYAAVSVKEQEEWLRRSQPVESNVKRFKA